MTNDEMGTQPGHDALRSMLRFLGPVMIIIGVILIGCFISSANDDFNRARSRVERGFPDFGGGSVTITDMPGGSPSDPNPLMFLGGGVCIMIGMAMCGYGYMGAAARYQAEEIAPVAKDAINYMVKGTEESVEGLARAVKNGLAESDPDADRDEKCPKCGKGNRHDAKFCDHCGEALTKVCPSCGKDNDPDARFCNGCGQAIS